MVSDIDRRKGFSATAAAEVFLGLDTDLVLPKNEIVGLTAGHVSRC